MRVALAFRLYMMRYGIGLLASSFTHQGRTTFSEDICKRVSGYLTQKCEVPEHEMEPFKEYVLNKPGSPRYTPLRQNIAEGKSVKAERQDLLLSDARLPSSVGALTQDYFDDSLSLAQMLNLVRKDHNLLLARGPTELIHRLACERSIPARRSGSIVSRTLDSGY